MSLADQIADDLKSAMKARDKIATGALRMMLAAVKELRVAPGRGEREPSDAEVAELLARMAKQRRESIATYVTAGRDDLAAIEEAELDVITRYLPEQLGEEELRAMVADAVAESGASGPGDLGTVMKALMPKVKGRADGKLVNQLVREALTG